MLIDVYEVEFNSIFLNKKLQSDGYAVLESCLHQLIDAGTG